MFSGLLGGARMWRHQAGSWMQRSESRERFEELSGAHSMECLSWWEGCSGFLHHLSL